MSTLVSERPWRLLWFVLKCTTANLLIQHTAKQGAGLGWGKRAHAGLVREDETSEYHTERYTSVEKWPAVALPEQMTVSQISLDRLRARLSEVSWYWCRLFQSQIWSSVSEEVTSKGSPQRQTNWFRKLRLVHLYARQPTWFLGETGRFKYHDTLNKRNLQVK